MFFAPVASIRHPRARQINGSHRISVVTPASAHDRLCSFPPPCSLPTTLTPKRAQQPNVQIRRLTFSPENTIPQKSFLCSPSQHWHRATTRITWWASRLPSLTWIHYLNQNSNSRSKHKLSLFLREDLNFITTVCQFPFSSHNPDYCKSENELSTNQNTQAFLIPLPNQATMAVSGLLHVPL